MNNRYLVGILTCLAEVAVFGIILADLALNCVQSYFSFPLNDYWTELLIDYSAGPVRRGLPGEILKHISFVPAQILWLAVLIISYVFIYSVFALRMIKLRIPFVLQAGVYLSPLLCFCLYNNFYFVNRDIVLLAAVLLILLPLSSVYRDREKASARKLALCSILMTVAGSAMIFSHAGSCTMLVLPLLVMALVSRGTLDFVIFALIPAVIFLAECLLINTSMSALSPDGIMTVLDEIKSRFPVVPGRPDESVLVTLRSLGAEWQSFWRGLAVSNQRNLPSVFLDAALLAAAAVLPLVLVLFRRRAAAGSVRLQYLKITAIIIASIAPMALAFVAVDYFRWRNWAFFLLVCSVLLLTREESSSGLSAKEQSPGFRIRYCLAVLISLAACAIGIRELSEELPKYLMNMRSLFNLGHEYRALTVSSKENRPMLDVPGRSWKLVVSSGMTVSDTGSIRIFKKDEEPAVFDSCSGAMSRHYFDKEHRRLFMSGYQLFAAGEDRMRKPPRSFGFLVSDGENRLYYPTVAYSGTADINGQKVSISSMYDDYVVIPPYMDTEKLKVYHAMYNLKGKIVRCSEPAFEPGK